MRIHTDTITRDDIYKAARAAGIYVEKVSEHGSRSKSRAFEVVFSGSGVTGGRWGNSGTSGAAPYKSATWDEWGIALNYLFEIDEFAVVPRVYDDRVDFDFQTGDRFRHLAPLMAHVRHRWVYDADWSTRQYAASRCSCGALKRVWRRG